MGEDASLGEPGRKAVVLSQTQREEGPLSGCSPARQLSALLPRRLRAGSAPSWPVPAVGPRGRWGGAAQDGPPLKPAGVSRPSVPGEGSWPEVSGHSPAAGHQDATPGFCGGHPIWQRTARRQDFSKRDLVSHRPHGGLQGCRLLACYGVISGSHPGTRIFKALQQKRCFRGLQSTTEP